MSRKKVSQVSLPEPSVQPQPSHQVSASLGFYDDQFETAELECLSRAKGRNMRAEINILRVLLRRMLRTMKEKQNDPQVSKNYLVVSKLCAEISNLCRTEKELSEEPSGKAFVMEALGESTQNFLRPAKEKK